MPLLNVPILTLFLMADMFFSINEYLVAYPAPLRHNYMAILWFHNILLGYFAFL